MCLILFALDHHPEYKFVLAANRDEYFKRPTKAADFWENDNKILAGRDLQSGGTWLGVNKMGRFIAITNYRDLKNIKPDARSRGDISQKYLEKSTKTPLFLDEISKNKNIYNGFNLLLSDDAFESIFHYSNISDTVTKISPGIHGLSNHLLDTPWPKIEYGKGEMTRIVNSDKITTNQLIEILKNSDLAPDESLPDTGISYDLEKKLSPVFISMNGYGTRCSTAILLGRNNDLSFHEVTYDENGRSIEEKKYNITIKP